MGAWSMIGSLAKNTVKIGGGYAIGNALSHSDDEAVSGFAGTMGIAGAYALPAVGSKLFNFAGSKLSNGVTDPKTGKTKFSCWKTIGKVAAIGAGTLLVGDQAMKWYDDHIAATENVHQAAENEYLQMGTSNTQSVQRTGEEALTDIQMDSESSEAEVAIP